MNKWRLLLLFIFALLHITTSDRIFIDGRYGCCDHTQRSLPSYESYQERRSLPEIRQLSKSDKYSTPDERDTDVITTTRRSRVEYRKQRSLDRVLGDSNRRAIVRQRTRPLSTIPEVIRGRQISRERINERVNDQKIGSRNERFERQLDRKYQRSAHLPSLTRNDNQRIAETRNRHLDDNICEVTHNIQENKIETQSTQRNTVNNKYDDGKEIGGLRGVRENVDRKISTRKIVFDTHGFENERNTRLTMRRYEREDYSRERELTRLTRKNNIRGEDCIEFKENNRRIGQNKKYSLVRNDVPLNEYRANRRDIRVKNIIKSNIRTEDRSNLKDNNGFISQINRRSSVRNVNDSPLNENHDRSSRTGIIRKNVIRNNVRIEDRNNLKEDNRRISKINRRSSTRNVNDASLNENRERSSRVDIRRKNMIRSNVRSEERRDSKENNERIAERSTHVDILAKDLIRVTRDSASKASRQISRQERDYTENRVERDSPIYNDRLRNIDKNLESTRMDHRQRRRDSKESARNVRVDDRIEFNKRSHNGRINFERTERRIQKRSLSEEITRNRDARIERSRHIDDRSSREYMEKEERLHILASKLNYNRHSDAMEVREINGNRVDVRRGNFERTSTRDSRTNEMRRNLPATENRARAVFKSQRYHRLGNDAIIRSTIRNQEVFSLPIQIREWGNLRESRDANSRERRANEQTDRLNIRREINSDRISNLRQERFEADNKRVKQDQNRISLRIRRNIVAEQRSVENIKVFHDESRQLRRRSNNKDQLSNREQEIRDNRDERRATKNTEDTRINVRQETSLLNEKRISRSDYVDSHRSNRMKMVRTQSDVFEIKWQYLFYIFQAVYLCSLLVKIPKDEGTKKMRIINWFTTPADILKID